ncbi:MAG TPA: folylpolyglutamate synthase/dihydrofolate synthase family protein [Steroidobacteraceae bacterium]|nr:folylpolyglutamate synthase/dihydrofolate synthase family protein [Steroidobacteraceae bacterium]
MRTLAEWLALQESVHPKTIDMGLARVSSVARTLGVDKPSSRVITVGGTNGKGSTVAHLDSLLRAAGASTGMFTSPHFIRYNERIRVGGVEVEDAELINAFERIDAARGSTTLTFFEYNALAALVIFADRGVDVAILEVGLGGRLDAVNLVDADVAAVCSIGFDHRDYLGDSLEQIGGEKAGIFRAGRPAVLSTPDMPASVYSVIQSVGARGVVAERDFGWEVGRAGPRPSGHVDPVGTASAASAKADAAASAAAAGGARWNYRGLRVALSDLPASALEGSIQYRNAAAALAAIESLDAGYSLNVQTVSQALRDVRLAGRFQVVAGPVEWILDIAHNEPAARVFAQHVRERRVAGAGPSALASTSGAAGAGDARAHGGAPGAAAVRTFAVVGILADKDAREIAAALAPLVDHWVLCSLPGARGSSASDLASRLGLPADQVTLADSVEEGCEVARAATVPGDRVIVFGSVYTVGPALQWLRVY